MSVKIYRDGNWHGTKSTGVEMYGVMEEELLKKVFEVVENEPDATDKLIKEEREKAEQKVKEVKERAESEVKEVVTPLRSMFRYAPDELVVKNAKYIEEWKEGVEFVKGDVTMYKGTPYRIITDKHTSTEQFTPDRTNYIYNDMTGKINPDNPDEIMEFVQPTGYADAYGKGDKVKFNGKVYESNIDGNTWSPEAAPNRWDLVEEEE